MPGNVDYIRLDVCIMKIVFDRPLGRRVKSASLRGAIGSIRKAFINFHHHDLDGSLVYRYPLIQYKVISREACIVGLQDGATELARLNIVGETMTLVNSKKYKVVEQRATFSKAVMGRSAKREKYVI